MYFGKNVERMTGLNLKEIRAFSPEKMRSHIENRSRKQILFVSEFPFIGRGNVLRDNLISRCEINKEIDLILSRA